MKEEQYVNPVEWGIRVFLILRVINPKLKTNIYCTGTLYMYLNILYGPIRAIKFSTPGNNRLM